MTFSRVGSAVFLAHGVEVGTRRDATVGKVTEFVNMEAVFAWFEAFNFSVDLNSAGLK